MTDRCLLFHSAPVTPVNKTNAIHHQQQHQPKFASRQSSTGSPSAATVTLLAVSFYQIITTLPVTVCYILNLAFPEGDPATADGIPADDGSSSHVFVEDPVWARHRVYRAIKITVEEMAMSKYALNFYIYLFTGSAFRRELRRCLSRLLDDNSDSGAVGVDDRRHYCCRRIRRHRRQRHGSGSTDLRATMMTTPDRRNTSSSSRRQTNNCGESNPSVAMNKATVL